MLDLPQRYVLKFKYEDTFFTIKKAYKKLLYEKSKQWVHDLVPLFHAQKQKTWKKSIFSLSGELVKFLQLDHFWTDPKNKWAYTTFFEQISACPNSAFKLWLHISPKVGGTLKHKMAFREGKNVQKITTS